MTNQDICDIIDNELSGILEPRLREMVLDAVWMVLEDNRNEEEDSDA